MPHRVSRAVAAVRRHWATVHSRITDRQLSDLGYSVTEWVFITAAGATVAGLIYAAVQSKALEKIGIINGS
ncbi:hypothetical protein AB0H07_40465 [Streptomyces sp. NPDC021354]|uniref:hypothetical protein n=1 Tax=Streptomyces sp. NPDC021354 TaxID=3154793 RepID=UPI0033F61244